MIFGRICKNGSELKKDQFSELKGLMFWDGCIYHKIDFGNFSGGIIYDTKLPYILNDFYCHDMQNETVVLMSGVIYNRDELIKLLSLNMPLPYDPEQVLHAFKIWGEEFVKKINGDFAIIIYEKKSNVSFLCRDHMGIRPLAFNNTEHSFWFSSDAMALCKTFNVDKWDSNN